MAGDSFDRYISVASLRDLLATMDDDLVLQVNVVGNLMVTRPRPGDFRDYAGAINIKEETYEVYEEEDEFPDVVKYITADGG